MLIRGDHDGDGGNLKMSEKMKPKFIVLGAVLILVSLYRVFESLMLDSEYRWLVALTYIAIGVVPGLFCLNEGVK